MLFLQNLVHQYQVLLSPVMTVRVRIILLMYISTPILLRDDASGQLLLLHENTRNGKWIFHDDNYQGVFCRVCRKSVPTQTQTSQGSGGVWVTNWKKAVEKMRAHESSDNHKKQIEAESIVSTGGTVIHHFQHIGDSDKSNNRNAISLLI